jgi:predicted transcriptional regulator
MNISQDKPKLTKLEAEAIAAVFQNPIRRRIIKLLLKGNNKPLYHNEIHLILKGSKSTIHRHLSELTLKNVLICKEGFISRSSKVLVDHYEINPNLVPLLTNLQKYL